MTVSTTAFRIFPAAVLAAATGLHADGPQAAQQQPAVQYETRADLILVDATVVDSNGTPVGDLTREDFVVSIDGQRRPIASLQFVKSAAATTLPPRPAASHYSSNEGESDARRIMIAIDENSVPPGGARAVLRSIERLLNDLSTTDRVGFVRLPRFEGSIDFTVDRRRVLEAVKKTTGRADPVGVGRVAISEAVAFDRDETYAWERALTRICGRTAPAAVSSPGGGGGLMNSPDPELAICKQTSENDAVEKLVAYRQRARETVGGLAQLLSNLRAVPGPKTFPALARVSEL